MDDFAQVISDFSTHPIVIVDTDIVSQTDGHLGLI